MGSRSLPPSDFELQILTVLWEHGPATVRQVLDLLHDGKDRAYTSVLSVMQVMQKKGLLAVERQRDSLAYVYKPKVTREKVISPMLKGLIDRMFGGNRTLAVQQLLKDGEIRPGEIEELRQLLNDLEERDS